MHFDHFGRSFDHFAAPGGSGDHDAPTFAPGHHQGGPKIAGLFAPGPDRSPAKAPARALSSPPFRNINDIDFGFLTTSASPTVSPPPPGDGGGDASLSRNPVFEVAPPTPQLRYATRRPGSGRGGRAAVAPLPFKVKVAPLQALQALLLHVRAADLASDCVRHTQPASRTRRV